MHQEFNPSQAKNHLVKLSAALNIYPGEGLPTFLLFIQAFCLGIALITFYSASNAIFLTAFSSEMIPYVYITAAIFITTGGVIFSQLQKHISFSLLLSGTLGILLITVTSLWIGLRYSNSNWLAFMTLVWSRIIWVLGNLELWALAGRLFNVRQGKRLFTLITAGAVLGVIFFGFMTAPMIRLIGTTNLILLTSFGLAGAMITLLYTLYRFKDRLQPASSDLLKQQKKSQGKLLDLFHNPYIVLIFIYTTFSTIGTYVLDFAFISQAGNRFGNVDALGNFFGNYLGFSTLADLVFLTLAAGWILNRFGLRSGIMANSVMVGLGAILVAISGLFSASATVIFWLIVATKLFDDVMVVAMTNTSVRILYQPLTIGERLTAQAAVESIIAPLAIGVSGGLLILFSAMGNIDALDAIKVLLGVLVVWLSAAILLSNRYKFALQNALKKRVIEESYLSFDDNSSLNVLEKTLQSDIPGEVLFALGILENTGSDKFKEFLVNLLHHPAPEVRQEALRKIIKYQLSFALQPVYALIQSETDIQTKATALETLCTIGSENDLEIIISYLDDPNLIIRAGAMVGLLKSGEVEGILVAGERLSQLERSDQPEERALAAKIYGQIKTDGFTRSLSELLQDRDQSVRIAALQAVGPVKNPKLWKGVIDNLQSPGTRRFAMSALSRGDESAIVELQNSFFDPGLALDVKTWLVQAAGRNRLDHSKRFLLSLVDYPVIQIRHQALEGLVNHSYQANNEERILIQTQINKEVERGAQLLAVLLALNNAHQPVFSPLEQALREELKGTESRLFCFLSFLFDSETILQAQKNLAIDSEERRAYAVEALDVTLPRREKEIMMPFLQPHSEKRQMVELQKIYPQEELTIETGLLKLLEKGSIPTIDWTKACAIYTAGSLGYDMVLEKAGTWGDELGKVSQETLSWTDANRTQKEGIYQEPPANRKSQGKKSMLLTIEKVIILKSVEIFSETPDSVLADLAGVLEEVSFKPGDTIIKKGDLGTSMYIIVEGEVRVHDEAGTLNLLSNRDVFGEMAILDPEPRSASITATKPTTLLKLEQDAFYELMDDRIEIVRGIIRVLTRRLRGMMEMRG